ncbi:MAG: transporter substrate-binding domain-containing protein [Colwellia sp.]|nr:transporter substrate-binding domain-containing protein [Colwellia sp.]
MGHYEKSYFYLNKQQIFAWFTQAVICILLWCPFSVNAESSIVEQQKTIKISLPDKSSIEAASGENFQLLVNFLKEYWQIWAIDQQQSIEFVYLSKAQAFERLKAQEIDIVALTIFEKKQPDLLFSIPYAKYQQRIFRRIQASKNNGIQIAIHSKNTQTLDFLPIHIERYYYKDIDKLLNNYQKFDAIYSTKPWLLQKKIKSYKLDNNFQVTTADAPEIFFRFAAHKNNRKLMHLINDGIRAITKVQAELWSNKFVAFDNNNISFALGDYFTNLSTDEKEFIIDHNQLYFPLLSDGFPPYVIVKNFNNITERGFTIDLFKLATKRTGVVYKPMTVKNVEQALTYLKQNKVNVLAHVEHTVERATRLKFSIPYLKAGYSMVYRHDDTIIDGLSGIGDKSIAVINNFNATKLLKDKLPYGKFNYYDTIIDAVSSVSSGQSDVFIGRSLTSSYLVKENQLSNLTSQPLVNFHDNAQFSFATTLENNEVISLLNRTINSMSASEYEKLYAKWSHSAFHYNNADEQVANAYRKARYLFAAIMVFGLIIFWIYYRQLRIRKLAQKKIEHALTIAEAAKTEAEASAQAKITFLARMSHEIRTPMNGVLGMAEALAFTSLNNEQSDLLETLQGSATNLLALLNDVLDFSKMDAGKLTLEYVPVNFHLICKNIINSFHHIEHNKPLDICLQIDSNITHSYFTDPTRLTQVLNNLLSNAIKFTQAGRIELNVKLLASTITNNNTYDTLSIKVKDSGIGIAADKHAFLFTPFIQADDDITRKFGGTGLGLSICQEIITAMGSEIKVDSEFGKGSTFNFTLKLKRSSLENLTDNRRKNTRKINKPNDNRFKDLRVLIAEDNLVNVKVLNAQLERLNIKADIANDGKEALELHEKEAYDIIISDCHMPNLDGFELAKILSQNISKRPLWLIAVTADALSGAAEKCISAGFDDYMAKPCPQEEITNKLNNAYRQLQKKQQRKKKKQRFSLFDVDMLLHNNSKDIELSKSVGQLFIDSWQKEKTQWRIATDRLEYKHIQALAHKLKGSTRYFVNKALLESIGEVEQYASAQNNNDLTASAAKLYVQLDVLVDEINIWLLSD